ncbi:radical SAM protein [Desulfosporosinus sp. PR]|uniref:SPL family radical SAM protein n=1 Tax=Candidatus Desulfosporosinus nitrosoreducens TaxID=3401928 RepID=UPI0027EE0F1D|nr:radical SAM protein [Desulfosporosinus sp. PR]MDQ7093102.1 radical SAM protein [Desulfosporosinus sp. PR]
MSLKAIPQEKLCKSALNKTGIPGFAYCMNPYVGCVHGCVYCYASFMCRFTGHQEKWGEFLDVKINFPAVLAKQLSGRRVKPEGKVLLGSVTDAYQPVEARYEITRSSLKILADYQMLKVNILTKSALVERDIAILRQMPCEVGFTITSLDLKTAQVFEPGASSPQRRVDALRQLIRAGIPVWVFIAPLLPGLADREEALSQLLHTLHEEGVSEILVDFLNPYPAVVHRLKSAYRQFFNPSMPDLEEYLSNPGVYRDKIKSRFQQISEFVGCHPNFISL